MRPKGLLSSLACGTAHARNHLVLIEQCDVLSRKLARARRIGFHRSSSSDIASLDLSSYALLHC